MAEIDDDLDEATLEAKLAEATSYDERAALRKALRARKKQRGDGAAAVRRGATGYNRFRTSNTTGKPQQQFIPAVAAGGGGGGRKSPSVTPARSTTPSSTTSPTPLSPVPRTATSPLPPSPQPTTPSPLPENEPIKEEKDEDEKVDEPQQEEEEKEEKNKEEEPQTEPDDQSEEWQMVDKEKTKELEREARIQARIAARSQDQHDGSSPFKVQLRSQDTPKPASTPATKTDQPKAEFQGYKLRKTPSQSKENNKPATTSSPRTLADYQRITSKPKTTATTEKISNPKEHELLVNYVNRTLLLTIYPDGSELYDMCCNPSTICKLINKSVRNTVDMRALTKTPPPSKVAAREEALQENMTLAVESARAIGCAVNDETEDKLIGKDRETFRHLLFDLIRARLVHQPGMDNAPSSVFENLSIMMEKLGLQSGETTDGNWRDADVDELRREVEQNEKDPVPPTSSSSWKEEPSDPKPAVDLSKSSMDDNLSYEERAAIRKAERERRKKEREALATAK